jgi:hypothetical protein
VQIEQRLVVDFQHVGGERVAQVDLEAAPRLRHHVHALLEEAPRASPIGLGAVEGHIGILEQLVGVTAVAGRQGDADAGADDHLLAADLEGLSQGSDHALGQGRGFLGVAQRLLQHHELVAAETRHHIALAHHLAQPLGDRAQQVVPAGMAQRVVDLLELVEVDEVNGERTPAPQRGDRRVHLVPEEGAIGQVREDVVARQLVDLGLCSLALGDVLEQHNGAAPRHGLEGEGQRAALLRIDVELTIDFVGEPALELDGQPLGIGRRQGSPGDAAQDELPRRECGAGHDRRHLEELGKPLVRNHDPALRIEHAQPVRHIVERGIEPRGEAAHIPARDHRVEQHAAQPVGNKLQRREEGRQHEGEDRIVGAPDQAERQRHGHAGADDLRIDEPAAGEVSARNADHVCQRQREAEDLHERIGRFDEGEEAPDAQQRHMGGRTHHVTRLPTPRFRDGRQVLAPPIESAHVQGAQTRHDGDCQRAQVEGRLSGLPGRNQGGYRGRNRADEKAAEILEKGVDQRDVNLGRRLLGLSAAQLPMPEFHEIPRMRRPGAPFSGTGSGMHMNFRSIAGLA